MEWAQCCIAFSSFEEAFGFSERIACNSEWTKRMVTTFEWPIPSSFIPITNLTREGKALVFLMIAQVQLDALMAEAGKSGGEITLAALYGGLRTTPLLPDYTWNHTTPWAMKQDTTLTYLQCGFSVIDARLQFARLKEKFGDEILFHIEWMKIGRGDVIPGSISLVRYTSEERLNELIDFCRSIGVSVANPHSNNVEGGGRYPEDNIQLLTKQRYDPRGLLNPGKMVTFQPA